MPGLSTDTFAAAFNQNCHLKGAILSSQFYNQRRWTRCFAL